MTRPHITIDGNEAVASVAHRTNEVIAIYPITPSSNMGEWADEWSAKGKQNIWNTVPLVVEMQSEGGASGAVHGALQAGALTTTFTASQGLLLMIPNMYKIAGELTSYCMHVSARTVASHALSIFGDHSDVMACRQTGFAMLASGSPQEAHDCAAIGQAATLQCRVPFLHFFDGFRTSHEVAKIEQLLDDDLRALLSDDLIATHRQRALSPEHPVLRGTAQNPDAFFQAREACNLYYDACPAFVQKAMDQFAAIVGRQYHLFDYVGHPQAERVLIMMGSGAEVAHEAVDWMVARGEKVGLIKVRLYRPFSIENFVKALPASVRAVGVLDRTKEAGAIGEPLYLDVVTAIREARTSGSLPLAVDPAIVGGRYGLSSKEFTPAMVKGVYDNLALPKPKNHFTIGINDDVTHLSLPYDTSLDIEPESVRRCVFFGLGSDGTVGANKNSIKIIGEETSNFAQGYFVYDSKKAGAVTISHLRFGPNQIRSSYLVRQANFVACHQYEFMDKYDVTGFAAPGAVFLLNSPFPADTVWDEMPIEVQQEIIDKKLEFYVIDAYSVGRDTGMGTRINTIMQTCFFAISGVLPRDEAIAQIKHAIEKTYGKRGHEVVREELCGRRSDAGQPAQGHGPRQGDGDGAPLADRLGGRTGLRQERHRAHARQQGRPPAGERVSDRRHLAHRDRPVGEAQHRAGHPRVGCRDLHPVQQVRDGLPARRHSREGLRPGAALGRAAHLQVDGLQGRRIQGHEIHHPGCRGRLHRLHAVRGGLPGQGQGESEAQVPRHDPAAPAARGRARPTTTFFLDLPEVDRTG